MKITIVNVNGGGIELEVDPSERIFDVKRHVEEMEGIPTDQQRLIFAGKQLEDEKTLADYNIQHGACLYQVMRLRGGGGPPAFDAPDPEKVTRDEVDLIDEHFLEEHFLEESAQRHDADAEGSHLVLRRGLNAALDCKEPSCRLFGKSIIAQFGTGTFEFTALKPACPTCGGCATPNDIGMLYLYRCVAQFVFEKKDGLVGSRKYKASDTEYVQIGFDAGDSEKESFVHYTMIVV